MKYRCIKDNFLWKKGAILHRHKGAESYAYYKTGDSRFDLPHTGDEVISARVVENNPEWFEPIADSVWENFDQKVKRAIDHLFLKMHQEWRK